MSFMPLGPMQEPRPSDTVLALIEAALNSDFVAVRRLGTTLVGSLPERERVGTQERLTRLFRGAGGTRPPHAMAPLDVKTKSPLVEELPWPTGPLFLDDEDSQLLERFIAEAQAADELAGAGLAPRSNLLLVGPPGTGKTLTAGHIAARLGLPFHVARLDTIVSSLLGDTAKNIRGIFDFVQREQGLLFLDEIDAVAKQRDDARDIGELKRVVNTLLQGLDRLDHRCVVIAASNHGHLLDPAVWRRFPYRLTVDRPAEGLRASLWSHYLSLDPAEASIANALAGMSEGLSGSDVAEIALAARRTAHLKRTKVSFSAIAGALLDCANGKFSLPTIGELDRDATLSLRRAVGERFGLTNGQLSALFSVTYEAVAKDARVKRAGGKQRSGLAQQSGAAADGTPTAGARDRRR
ncbi:AAA family ATPase [Azospirillum melinis]|uniref:AAA family ATPase n=1 Tax=Azospirillum melinis TaxID=328839 RepID=A0ABX2KCM3_9PROT|nr:ATP-binding protein [Azospirillum melinis]MBP2306312.1 hypothetical protein [Azospirillum melinis]NUB00252.1 AAA family ATPase [Azospirillum melinis]